MVQEFNFLMGKSSLKYCIYCPLRPLSLTKHFRDTIGAYTSHDLTIAENVVNNPGFDLTRTTMIYIHGWNQSPYSPGSQEIVNAYISNGRYNILVLDWSQAASGAITTVMFRVDEVFNKIMRFHILKYQRDYFGNGIVLVN